MLLIYYLSAIISCLTSIKAKLDDVDVQYNCSDLNNADMEISNWRPCPLGSVISKDKKFCYYFGQEHVNAHSANQICRGMGGYLAPVNDLKTINQLQAFLAKYVS